MTGYFYCAACCSTATSVLIGANTFLGQTAAHTLTHTQIFSLPQLNSSAGEGDVLYSPVFPLLPSTSKYKHESQRVTVVLLTQDGGIPSEVLVGVKIPPPTESHTPQVHSTVWPVHKRSSRVKPIGEKQVGASCWVLPSGPRRCGSEGCSSGGCRGRMRLGSVSSPLCLCDFLSCVCRSRSPSLLCVCTLRQAFMRKRQIHRLLLQHPSANLLTSHF